ncbi:MAG: aspartate aminotransferase family protein [Pirellulaceae bacterium]|nr:aspartate aminotransferase family protein [Pirellulaceae bacterium]
MSSLVHTQSPPPIEHPGEELSNAVRRRLCDNEPHALRTYTPSLAVLARSAGSYHWTPEGRKLADFTSGVLVANLGHNPTRWWQRVLRYMQLEQLAEPAEQPFVASVPLTAYNAVTPLEVEACERLLANMRAAAGGERMERVLWSASGSEAIQKALWAAMDWKGHERPVILATRRGFHGKKGLAGAVTGSEQDPERDPRVKFLGFPLEECRDVTRSAGPLDLTPYERELAELADQYAGRIACLVTEPYLGGGGSYHPPAAYMQLLERFCRDQDALFILDEIQANFGRTGPMYAYTHYGVQPDIVCLGKGLGNGVPVSAAVGRADVFAAMHYGEGSDTWSANPLSSAAVLATLDEFETEDVLGQGRQLSALLRTSLLRLKETGLVEHVRGEGCVWGVECRAAGEHTSSEVAQALVLACYLGDRQGRAIHLLGPLSGNVLRVSPPLVMPLDEAAEYLQAIHGIFEEVAERLESPLAPP